MLVLLSPAKKMRSFDSQDVKDFSTPQFHEAALPLVNKLSKFTKPKLMKLMAISPQLAATNLDRYQSFSTDAQAGNLTPAIHAFNGDVYLGLESTSLNKSQINFADKHVRILSGLYGYLKPKDLIQPYRLEMGSKLSVGRRKNLYAYWKDKIPTAINSDLDALREKTIINLASKEYFQVVEQLNLKARIITVHFREYRDGKLRAIQFNLKRARGLLTRYIVENKISSSEDVKGFNVDNYYYEENLSDHDNWYFVR